MMRRHGFEILLWIALLTVPLWLPYVGGYSALGSKILVYGLAALAPRTSASALMAPA
jgi:branched-chain amino acid transport system permease protein